MSDIRCPMCGKPNPSDLEVCQYCQARLKPLLAGSRDDDWRRDVLGEGFTEDEPEAEQELDAGDDLPDWLKELRPADEVSPEGESEQTPDWEELGLASPAEEKTQAEGLAWLTELRQSSVEEQDLAAPESPSERAAFPEPPPDWLAELGGKVVEDVEVSQEGEEAPDWFRELEEKQKAQEAQTQVAPFQSFEEYAPRADQEVVPSSEAAPGEVGELPIKPEEEAAQIPKWLEDWEEPIPGEEAVTQPAAIFSQGEAEERPEPEADIFSPIEESPETGYEAGAGESKTTPETALPEWLQALQPDEEVEQAGEEAETKPPPIEFPAWLSEQKPEATPEAFEPGAVESMPDLALDWLQSEREALEKPPEAGEVGEQLPAALFGEHALEAEEPLYSSSALPDWLGEAPEIPASEEGEESSAEEAEQLARAELPSWLKAIRPIEAATLETPLTPEIERHVEGSGPLAGLRSVLPGDIDIGGRAPAYTVKLQVSESQKAHAALITELIRTEGEPMQLKGHRARGSQRVFLIGIFVVLLLGLLWPLAGGSQSAPMPYFSEVYEASSAINSLGVEKPPVLVAVDYEPGLSGEMEATANAVIDHLMIRGAYLTMVSTTPTGAMLTERLTQGANQRGGHTYSAPGQYANLGYLPGGALGIRSFAEAPRRLLPFSQDGSAVWDAAPLSGVQSVADFAMALVLTDNPLTARVWIEQMKPLMGAKPLVMVVSAQVEPIVRPYFEAEPKIVDGIVAGLPGGASYEQMFGRFSLARAYWDAYSIGVVLIAAMVVVGGAVQLFSHLLSNRKQAAREAKE